ncbi:MAG TPA: DEAD/DEAH box helicase, partial [Clostridia bacterium]|nr:DEAD/DEAH box helicase [Clostridia bacterium]
MQLTELPGMGPVRCRALQEAGICDARALVERLPEQYQDSTHPVPLAQIAAGMTAAFSGCVRDLRCHWVRRQALVSVTLEEDGAALRCIWFGAVWLSQQLVQGQRLLLYGRIARGKDGRLQAVHPALVDKPALLPIYRAVEKVPPKSLRGAIRCALDRLPDSSEIPEDLIQPLYPGTRREALICAHFPENREALEQARRRLSYETLLLYQAGLRLLRGNNPSGVALKFQDSDLDRFWDAQAFAPTHAQRRVAREIALDLRAPYAMARLVQGDVGCGKTAIAFSALYACVVGGYQGAMMAPTEVLAAQHYQSSRRMLEPMGIRCGLLTGRLTAKQRREAYAAIASGEWQAVFGTHALISAGVRFHRLGLAITDEQHRFGVHQRLALSAKGPTTDLLVMTATPIPRTLMLAYFGDMDVSRLTEKPAGRKPIATVTVPQDRIGE